MYNKPCPDPTQWLPPREIERRVAELFDRRGRRQRISQAISLLIGFLLGYLAWGVWPLWGLLVKLFNECYFGG